MVDHGGLESWSEVDHMHKLAWPALIRWASLLHPLPESVVDHYPIVEKPPAVQRKPFLNLNAHHYASFVNFHSGSEAESSVGFAGIGHSQLSFSGGLLGLVMDMGRLSNHLLAIFAEQEAHRFFSWHFGFSLKLSPLILAFRIQQSQSTQLLRRPLGLYVTDLKHL